MSLSNVILDLAAELARHETRLMWLAFASGEARLSVLDGRYLIEIGGGRFPASSLAEAVDRGMGVPSSAVMAWLARKPR